MWPRTTLMIPGSGHGVLKRRANYSPIICFETVDPKRIYRFLSDLYCLDPEFQDVDNVFLYDPWDGLGT